VPYSKINFRINAAKEKLEIVSGAAPPRDLTISNFSLAANSELSF